MDSRVRRTVRFSIALVALLVGLVAAGCGGDDGGGEAGGGDGKRPKVALVQINQQAAFFNEMNKGAKEAAATAGVELTIFNANDDATAQNTAIENYVTQQFDAIIAVAIDVDGIKPALRAAKSAGLNVVAVDAIVEDPAVDVQVGVDNNAAGRQIGEFVNQRAKDDGGESLDIGIVGALNSFIQNDRKDSFAKTVEAAGHRVVQTVDGKNQQEDALAAAENLLTSQRQMNAVYATGEPAMVGAVAATKSQRAQDRVKLFGWDLTKDVIAGIEQGFVVGVVQQDPKTEGEEAVKAAKALVQGGQVEKRIEVPVAIVTKENVDSYRAAFGG